jgi:hypothetical protein
MGLGAKVTEKRVHVPSMVAPGGKESKMLKL